jgi:ubiquinone/menaquinone biosynthesis C-methylase UbiE
MIRPVDYDTVAAGYSNRYVQNDYSGVSQALIQFATSHRIADGRILEVGCGTGHWLRYLREFGIIGIGIDPSSAMLGLARTTVTPNLCLIRGHAEALPLRSRCFSGVFCINALHHFIDPAAFFREARRVVEPGGGLLTVGLDPHTGRDRWWIYDYFPNALVADQARYRPSHAIREMMTAAGFQECETQEVQHLPRALSVDEAITRGFLNRTSTSQLMVITDEDYQLGMVKIRADNIHEDLVLRADLRLYGTIGLAAA